MSLLLSVVFVKVYKCEEAATYVVLCVGFHAENAIHLFSPFAVM